MYAKLAANKTAKDDDIEAEYPFDTVQRMAEDTISLLREILKTAQKKEKREAGFNFFNDLFMTVVDASADDFNIQSTRSITENRSASKPDVELIPGGLSEGKTVEDIAKKHGVSVESIEKQIEFGIKIEMEHTDDPDVAANIAANHLDELPDYYDRLEKMERVAGGTGGRDPASRLRLIGKGIGR